MKKLFNLCMKYYNKYKEIVNYLIVGGITTVLALSVYYISVLTFLNPENKLELQLANILSWTSALIFAYFTNRKFVFQSKEKNKLKEAGSFAASRVVTLLMDMFIMYMGVSVIHFSDKIVKLFSQVIITVSNYVFSKLFVFKKKKEVKETIDI